MVAESLEVTSQRSPPRKEAVVNAKSDNPDRGDTGYSPIELE
jgi:hypothetical protein